MSLTDLIQRGKIDEAINLVKSPMSYRDSEDLVRVVLEDEKSTPELIEAALEGFLATRQHRKPEHGYWVHSLSHFTHVLWEKGLTDWVKKFNDAAFRGAIELDDSNCSARLVYDYTNRAKWDDNPADFHLDLVEQVPWEDWEQEGLTKEIEQIKMGKFASEEQFLTYKFDRVKDNPGYDYHVHLQLVSIEELKTIIDRMQAIGMDVSEVIETTKSIIAAQIQTVESKKASTDAKDWGYQGLVDLIAQYRSLLESWG